MRLGSGLRAHTEEGTAHIIIIKITPEPSKADGRDLVHLRTLKGQRGGVYCPHRRTIESKHDHAPTQLQRQKVLIALLIR